MYLSVFKWQIVALPTEHEVLLKIMVRIVKRTIFPLQVNLFATFYVSLKEMINNHLYFTYLENVK